MSASLEQTLININKHENSIDMAKVFQDLNSFCQISLVTGTIINLTLS